MCVLPESQRQSVFFIGSKFRAASFRPTLIGNACKACHSRYNAHLFSCLVCIKEQREAVDVLLSKTIRRDEALQSKQTRKQCVFSYRFPCAASQCCPCYGLAGQFYSTPLEVAELNAKLSPVPSLFTVTWLSLAL